MAGRYPEAIALLERLRAERPDDRELRTYLGGVYATAGRIDDAGGCSTRRWRTTPTTSTPPCTWRRRMLFGAALRRCRPAGRARRWTLRPGSADADAAARRRRLAARPARRRPRWLESAAAANPRDAKALSWVGTIARERGRTAEALGAFQRVAGPRSAAGRRVGRGHPGGPRHRRARRRGAGGWRGRSRWRQAMPAVAELERRVAAGGRT